MEENASSLLVKHENLAVKEKQEREENASSLLVKHENLAVKEKQRRKKKLAAY